MKGNGNRNWDIWAVRAVRENLFNLAKVSYIESTFLLYFHRQNK
jgi:hypothetical protein